MLPFFLAFSAGSGGSSLFPGHVAGAIAIVLLLLTSIEQIRAAL